MSSNVIALPRHTLSKPRPFAALAKSFARHRRDQSDVYWLKENAELLSILECTGAKVQAQDLECYLPFYQSLPERITFFPQYYRFLTSIALDLEALGIEGGHAATLCAFVHENNLIEAELSDLQRAETARLLMRRSFEVQGDQALRRRLHQFIDNCATFALPNRKVAYELTHIVFYLSEYGRRDPELSAQACTSLMFTGILAHLEQNADLLAEVCVALRYGGRVPPARWEQWIETVVNGFDRVADLDGAGDNYHEYLVTNWACAQKDSEAFGARYCATGQGFFSPVVPLGALSCLSEVLFEWHGPRIASWAAMEDRVYDALPHDIAQHLNHVVEASADFDALFSHFVRAPGARKTTRAPLVRNM